MTSRECLTLVPFHDGLEGLIVFLITQLSIAHHIDVGSSSLQVDFGHVLQVNLTNLIGAGSVDQVRSEFAIIGEVGECWD